MNSIMNIPGLEEVTLTKVSQSADRLILHVELARKPHMCPACKSVTSRIHDYRLQKIGHLKWFERPTFLLYKRRRYACGGCGKRFAEKNTFVDRYQRFTREWNQAVKVRAVKGKTFKETALQYGAAVSTVMRRFDALAKTEIKDADKLPKVIAIDEYKGDTQAGRYQLIIADGETREPIDILPNRRKKTIRSYLRKYGSEVEVVIMDMSQSFKAAVQSALGRPVIVADRFHFCRYIYWALDGVRRRVQANWHDYDRKKCKKMRHVFHKDNAKLTEKGRWYLDRYLGMDEELERAYRLKEAYCEWFQESKKRGPEASRRTKEKLEDFYREVEKSAIPEFQKAMATFRNWQKEILNSFSFCYSNGFLEGINNLTKVLKRNAFGFRNFDRARAKILLTHRYKEIGGHIG